MEAIIRAWNALVRLVRPDVDAIISTFLKAQSKLGKFIDAQEAALAKEAAAIDALIQRNTVRNAAVNRAYRIIHNLDKVTA